MPRCLPAAVCCLLAPAFFLVLSPLARADDGKLQRARDQVRGRDRGSHGSSSRSRDSDDDDDDSGNVLTALINALFSAGDSGPSPPSSESSASDTESAPSPTYRYAPYPYAGHSDGYLVPRQLELAYNGEPRPLASHSHAYAVQLSLEAGYLNRIARGGPSLRLLTPSRVELDTRWSLLHESLEHVQVGESDSDATNLGSSHLSYRLGEDEAGLLRVGAGLRYLVDGQGADAGIDFLLGADLFLGRPFVLSLELTAGTLGEAIAFAPRAQLGVMLGRVELFAGYEHLIIGDVQLPVPLLGSRIWL